MGHTAIGEFLANPQADLQRVAPPSLGDRQAELYAQVEQPGFEDVPSGVLKGLGLFFDQVLIKLGQDGNAVVDLLPLDGLFPLGEQFLLTGLTSFVQRGG